MTIPVGMRMHGAQSRLCGTAGYSRQRKLVCTQRTRTNLRCPFLRGSLHKASLPLGHLHSSLLLVQLLRQSQMLHHGHRIQTWPQSSLRDLPVYLLSKLAAGGNQHSQPCRVVLQGNQQTLYCVSQVQACSNRLLRIPLRAQKPQRLPGTNSWKVIP